MRASPESKRMIRRSPTSWQAKVRLASSSSSLLGLCSQPAKAREKMAAAIKVNSRRIGIPQAWNRTLLADLFRCAFRIAGKASLLTQDVAKLHGAVPAAGLRREDERAE